MALTYGFFNSLNHDRVYNADQMSEYFKGLISDGVYESVGDALQVTAGTGMNVYVGTGRALINSKWAENDAIMTLPVTAAHVTLPRYTAVVIQLDITNRLIRITTKDGTPASSPTKPVITTKSATLWELCLAFIYVPAGATQILQANITDTRGTLCPYVTGIIKQVDTSELFTQWQNAFQNYYNMMTAEFTEWLDTLTEDLNINTFIQEFKKSVVLSGENVVPLDMTGYGYGPDDIIFVSINGLNAAEGTDWTLDSSVSPPGIQFSMANPVDENIDIRVLKSKIAFNTLIDAEEAMIVTDDNDAIQI